MYLSSLSLLHSFWYWMQDKQASVRCLVQQGVYRGSIRIEMYCWSGMQCGGTL